MKQMYRLTTLSNLLKRVERFEEVDPLEEYHFAGTYSFGRGIFAGERKLGSDFRLPKVQRIYAGDFVYCKIMAWEGAFGLVPKEADNCVMSGAFVAYEIDQTQADPKYLAYYFKVPSVWRSVGSQSTGTNVRRRSLHPEQFEKTNVPLPHLEEQRRIVARIEELAAKIEEARGLRREAVEEAEVIINIHAQRLLSTTTAELTELKCWLDLSRDGIQTGPFGAQLSSHDFESSGVPVLSISNIQYYGLKLDNLKYVSVDKAQQLSRFSIKEGDILFARMGTVGRCCVAPKEAEGWLFNYHIIRVALDKSEVDPRYIHWSIRASKDIEQYLDEKIRGATREGVNSSIVGSLPVRIPALCEQHHIVTHLDNLQVKVDNLKRVQSETSAELDALLPSILDKAFKGEL